MYYYVKYNIDITPFTFFTLHLRRNQLQTLWRILF